MEGKSNLTMDLTFFAIQDLLLGDGNFVKITKNGSESSDVLGLLGQRENIHIYIYCLDRGKNIHIHIHIHIHIYIWRTPHFMGRFNAKMLLFPQFYSKNAQILQPPKGGCKFVLHFSSFSLLLPFSALFFLFSSASIHLKA